MTTQPVEPIPLGDLPAPRPAAGGRKVGMPWVAWALIVALGVGHGAMVWVLIGARAGLTNGWPLLQDDHGIHYHQALVTRHLLATTGTTAGYDPGYMAGYPLSIVSDLSSTLPDMALFVSGSAEPTTAYKVFVLLCTAALPWLVVAAGAVWRAQGRSRRRRRWCCSGSISGPTSRLGYSLMGMIGYLSRSPLGLLAVASVTAYLRAGGFRRRPRPRRRRGCSSSI